MDELVINLSEVPVEQGKFRTQNSSNERFRPLLVDRGNQLLTKVRIVGITHGELCETNDSATLLIFEFRFVATGGRRFKNASATFTFADSERQMRRDPVVHAICPDGQWALNRTEKIQTVKRGASAGIKAGVDLGGAELGFQWEATEAMSRGYYTALSGSSLVNRRPCVGDENVVVWELEENEDKKDGIPTFMRAAVLLRRPFDTPFTFTVKIQTDVDFIGEMKTLFGMERKDQIDPVEIAPGVSPRARHATVATLDPKAHNLREMDNLDLKQVAGVTVVTILDGAQLDGGTKGAHREQP
ncbi:hypothetical protein NOR_07964 [Metarhizium rileyi]|uniref:Uncharacterized protein n=1 Tax=Metarhizium rileyi (strain RCEF 4871) TaxID=1649241 RepID=A0A166S015_METRR|nr:hypothetical protein NOR_07964 [Metarhizium rileyi RCEF 4871]TWU74165.1 hypothetical protein ED733_000357 [Metarhizium rileyi]